MKIDIHSHHLPVKPGQKGFLAIEASFSNDFQAALARYDESVLLSVGIHPWSALFWDLNAIPFLMDVFLDSKVHLIGEIGLDKVSTVPFELQLLVFKSQLEMAEKARKPVLLHVVRAMSEVLEIKKHFPAIPLWIIHGFRGGKQAAEQYIKKGFYLSFGPRFNKEGLLACPVDRLFLETDDSGEDIGQIYEQVAKVLNSPVESLEKHIESTFSSFFMK